MATKFGVNQKAICQKCLMATKMWPMSLQIQSKKVNKTWKNKNRKKKPTLTLFYENTQMNMDIFSVTNRVTEENGTSVLWYAFWTTVGAEFV